LPDALTTDGSAPLFGTFRLAQKPTDPSVAPGGIARLNAAAGVTVATPDVALKFPFQVV
jgi:hypothetical protein